MTEQSAKQFADVQQANKTCADAWARLAARHDELGALLQALPDSDVFHVTPYGESEPVAVTAKDFKTC